MTKTVKELLAAQAEAINKQKELQARATYFEQQAASARLQLASAPHGPSKGKIAFAKGQERFDRFAAAKRKVFDQKITDLLSKYGFKLKETPGQPSAPVAPPVTTEVPTTTVPDAGPKPKEYVSAANPGYMIIINGKNFTVKYHEKVEAEGEVEFIEPVLANIFKPAKAEPVAPATPEPTLAQHRANRFDSFVAANAKRQGYVEPAKTPAPPKPAQSYKSPDEDPLQKAMKTFKGIMAGLKK